MHSQPCNVLYTLNHKTFVYYPAQTRQEVTLYMKNYLEVSLSATALHLIHET